MNSPFPYDSLSTNNQFFGRENEIRTLTQTVDYGNNLLIHSKRRIGKTSLINHFLTTREETCRCIFVDAFDITSKEDFAGLLLQGLAKSQKTDLKTAVRKLSSLFKRVRLEPTVDPQTFEYSLKPIVSTLSFSEMMDDFFSSIDQLSRSEKIIIAIDEFQQIAAIKDVRLDALLRKHIQQRENTSYIFLGSKRHLLTSLFAYQAPLYDLAAHLELQPLSPDDILAYAAGFLKIDADSIAWIFEKSAGETKMIQHILHILYCEKDQMVSRRRIDDAVNEIVNAKEASYRIIFDTLNNNQKKALKIIGKYNKGFYGNQILSEYGIRKQTLQSSVEALFGKELIDKEGDSYFIPDRALELWVERLR